MKKSKKTLYLLIVVVGIYAAIIVRFFMMNNEADSENLRESVAMDFIPERFTTTQEFKIANDYRDPFLLSNNKAVKKIKSLKSPPKKNTKIDSILFPRIKYKGLVSDTYGKEKIFALTIENNEYVVSKGRTVNGVEILSGSSTKIELRFKGEIKTIKVE